VNTECFDRTEVTLLKKIDSIGYGHRFIYLSALFTVVLPVCSYALSHLFYPAVFLTIMRVSLGIGLLISLFFVVLLTVEFHQDKMIDKNYAVLRKTKQAIGNGQYECQSCGNRKIKELDEECGICGVTFDPQKT